MPKFPRRLPTLRIVSVAALLLLTGLSGSAAGQSLTFGELSGTVLDAGRVPVRDAEVRAVDRASGSVRTVAVGRDGRFRFGALAAGRYDVTGEALGFRPMMFMGIDVAAGHSATVAFHLRPTLGGAITVDTLQVTAAASTGLSWLFERGYTDLVGARRTLGDAALLTTTADESAVEGLPWRQAGIVIDGARSTPVGTPGGDL